MAIHEGAKYLEEPFKGRGLLLVGVPGVAPAKVVALMAPPAWCLRQARAVGPATTLVIERLLGERPLDRRGGGVWSAGRGGSGNRRSGA